jgi:ATP-dependent Clp protease ATP-binding subunit ClpX
MYELPSRDDVAKVVVDADVVVDNVNPTLVPKETKSRQSRPKRAAS